MSIRNPVIKLSDSSDTAWPRVFCGLLLCVALNSPLFAQTPGRPRSRDIGIRVGVLQPGPLDAITDVAGVKVGHKTLIRADNIRTGITAVLPHDGNLYQQKVPGAVFLGNAFGKLIGSTQVNELGEIETPILLTSTLSAPRVADALLTYMLNLPGNETALSINPLVGETNDGFLNDIRSRPIQADDVLDAIHSASGGPVQEGCVGAGTGTVAFGLKGGIGTSSRRVPSAAGGYTVGVLVQTNFGGFLRIVGVPFGEEIAGIQSPKYSEGTGSMPTSVEASGGGSIMIVVATDAPIEHRNLNRLASRAIMGLARTGSSGSGHSGDYVIAFSTAAALRIQNNKPTYRPDELLGNPSMDVFFQAVIEATEEAVYNSLLKACDMSGNGHTVKALQVEPTIALLRSHKAIVDIK